MMVSNMPFGMPRQPPKDPHIEFKNKVTSVREYISKIPLEDRMSKMRAFRLLDSAVTASLDLIGNTCHSQNVYHLLSMEEYDMLIGFMTELLDIIEPFGIEMLERISDKHKSNITIEEFLQNIDGNEEESANEKQPNLI